MDELPIRKIEFDGDAADIIVDVDLLAHTQLNARLR